MLLERVVPAGHSRYCLDDDPELQTIVGWSAPEPIEVYVGGIWRETGGLSAEDVRGQPWLFFRKSEAEETPRLQALVDMARLFSDIDDNIEGTADQPIPVSDTSESDSDL